MSDIVVTWTGRHADALRQSLRMTNETFAEHLGIAVRTVAYWRARPDVVPTVDIAADPGHCLSQGTRADSRTVPEADRRQRPQTSYATGPDRNRRPKARLA